MIKIVDTRFGIDIDIKQGYVCSLVIEHPKVFCDFVSDIHGQLCGEKGSVVLSENYVPLDIKKSADVITQLVPFTVNRKELLGKIYSKLNETAVNDEMYLLTLQMYSYMEKYLYELTDSFSSSLVFKRPDDTGWLLKGFGVGFDEQDLSLPEKLLEYMLAMNEYVKKSIFFVVGLRSFLTDKQAYELYRNLLLSGITLICIDSCDCTLLDCEHRTIIDKDMCII